MLDTVLYCPLPPSHAETLTHCCPHPSHMEDSGADTAPTTTWFKHLLSSWLRVLLEPPHTDPATEELIPPAGGLEEPTGEKVKVEGCSFLSTTAVVCSDWWVVKYFEYHPGKHLKTLSQHNAPDSHHQLIKVSGLEKNLFTIPGLRSCLPQGSVLGFKQCAL